MRFIGGSCKHCSSPERSSSRTEAVLHRLCGRDPSRSLRAGAPRPSVSGFSHQWEALAFIHVVQATSLERTGRALLTRSPVGHTDPFGPRGLLGPAPWSLCVSVAWLPRGPPILLVPSWLWSRGPISSDWQLAVGITEERGTVFGGSGRWLRSHTGFPVPARARPGPPPPSLEAPCWGASGILPPSQVCAEPVQLHTPAASMGLCLPVFCDLRKGRALRRRGWPGRTISVTFAGARHGAAPGDGALRALCSWWV